MMNNSIKNHIREAFAAYGKVLEMHDTVIRF